MLSRVKTWQLVNDTARVIKFINENFKIISIVVLKEPSTLVFKLKNEQVPSVFKRTRFNLLLIRLVLIGSCLDRGILQRECTFFYIDYNLEIKANFIHHDVSVIISALLNAE